MSASPWYLLADVGGTNARFAAVNARTLRTHKRWDVRADRYADLHAALAFFRSELGASEAFAATPEAACFSIASPKPEAACITMPNAQWVLERRRAAHTLGLDRIEALNDFTAVGFALRDSEHSAMTEILPGQAMNPTPRLVIGSGTGLGMSCLVPAQEGTRVLATEGGHMNLPVATEVEWSLQQFLASRHGHVSAERVLSGPGLRNLYRFFGGAGLAEVPDAPQITERALLQADPVAAQAVEQFCATLGAVAANAVLTQGARGGVVLVGNILRELSAVLPTSAFAARFRGKGRYRSYMEAVPVHLHPAKDLGLAGALHYLLLRLAQSKV